jgi:hypothetical protein
MSTAAKEVVSETVRPAIDIMELSFVRDRLPLFHADKTDHVAMKRP